MRKALLVLSSVIAIGVFNSCANTTTVAKAPTVQPNIKNLYKKEQEEEIISLLRTPPTPIKTPDTILRILILPYVNKKGILVTSHYVFVDANRGQWVIGNYLLQQGKALREINPLAPISSSSKN